MANQSNSFRDAILMTIDEFVEERREAQRQKTGHPTYSRTKLIVIGLNLIPGFKEQVIENEKILQQTKQGGNDDRGSDES